MSTAAELSERILAALRRREHGAALVPEVVSTLRPSPPPHEVEAALRVLGAEGRVLIAEHAPPDIHLESADLRVVAMVSAAADEAAAQEAAEAYWNGWLRTFLATHRCQ